MPQRQTLLTTHSIKTWQPRVERLENELAAMKRMMKRLRTDTGQDSEVA